MKRFRKQFQGLYWRQLLVIVSMVMLTLFLLGASFFSLSYNYAKNQESGEMQERARMVAQLAAGYLNHSPDYDQENFRQLATVAATMTDVDFLISDTKGHVLLSTDETMEGKIINLPWDLTQAAIEGEGKFQRTDLNGLYDAKRFVAGVPVACGGRGIRRFHQRVPERYVAGVCGPLFYDRFCGADGILHGLLCHRHAADPAHPGDGPGHPAVRRGGF